MPDYHKMYLTMAKATEDAINILIQAQREAEDIYISSPDPDIRLFTSTVDDTDPKPE